MPRQFTVDDLITDGVRLVTVKSTQQVSEALDIMFEHDYSPMLSWLFVSMAWAEFASAD